MEITKKQIEEINAKAPNIWQENEQGIFTEPYGIPNDVKSPVIYMRWVISGFSGGNCWGDEPQYFEGHGEPNFEALDLTLKELIPNISYLKYKEIEKIIKSSQEDEWEYYGNGTKYGIKFVILDELIDFLKQQNT